MYDHVTSTVPGCASGVHMASMKQINVAFPSGRGERLLIPESSNVGNLRTLAQETFGQGFLKLVTAKGVVLTDATESLQAAGLEDGDHVTALAVEPILAASGGAFALCIHGGDRVVTWGRPAEGGDSSAVQGKLRGVQQIASTRGAFAAILEDGSLVTWGNSERGGDSSAVQHQLKTVQQVQQIVPQICSTGRWICGAQWKMDLFGGLGRESELVRGLGSN